MFRKGKINVPLLYFHRVLRLTPLLAAMILFSLTVLRFLINGPLYTGMIKLLTEKCETNWLLTLLYVQNYVDPNNVVGDQRCNMSSNLIQLILYYGSNISSV